MTQILKRLELISNAISIEEEEIIELQISKLSKLTLDEEARAIVQMVKNHDYQDVITRIGNYVHRFSGLEVYIDPQVQGLKVELKILEKEVNKLSEIKIEYLSDINTFNSEYYRHLGSIIEEILRLKRDLAKKSFDKGELGEEEYRAFEEQYESFYQDAISQSKEQPMDLTADEEKELKKCYRKASRLTHPDIVADAFKDEATEIFVALNTAYKKKDLDKVKEILLGLESGSSFAYGSDDIDDKELLKAKSKTLKNKIETLKSEITQLKESEVYITIQETEDMEAYFIEMKQNLIREKEDIYLELIKQ